TFQQQWRSSSGLDGGGSGGGAGQRRGGVPGVGGGGPDNVNGNGPTPLTSALLQFRSSSFSFSAHLAPRRLAAAADAGPRFLRPFHCRRSSRPRLCLWCHVLQRRCGGCLQIRQPFGQAQQSPAAKVLGDLPYGLFRFSLFPCCYLLLLPFYRIIVYSPDSLI
ncbi:Os02g0303200, partial [Oryza sativa Japonica Group]